MIENFHDIPKFEKQYPFEFIENSSAIILEESADSVTVGRTDKTKPATLEVIEKYHKKHVKFIHLTQMELSSWISKQNRKVENDDRKEKNRIDNIEENAPVINLVNSICEEGIRRGASDIHIEAGDDYYSVRYRIDGVLQTYDKYSNGRFSEISTRIKLMADMNILEKRLPQDGRITVTIKGMKRDLRVSIVPLTEGESIVLRLLQTSEEDASNYDSLNKLGFTDWNIHNIRQMMKIQHGLILITGPTGSGKTTTVNAMLKELIDDEIKIITLEDPVEIKLKGVNQIQINENIGLGFDTILRRVLRQDPDIIMVGEIRDCETAKLCIRAALTGHMVLSTLHTNDSIGSITRLINMGIEPYLVANVLKGAVAQRLVRKLAPDGTFKGRTVLAESFIMNRELENLISRNASEDSIKKFLSDSGMKFLKDDGIDKLNRNITTQKEIEKEIKLLG